jgi:putative peptidoglycan lipid II flippase
MIISAGVVAGRFAGIGRDIVLAGTLGIGTQADIAVLVLSFPDLLTSLLVSGVVAAILVPDFKTAQASGGSRRLLVATSLVVGAVSVAIGLLAAFLAPVFVRLLAPGLPGGGVEIATPLFVIASAVFPLTALAAVFTAYLQAHGRFAVPAAGTLIFNLTLIVAIGLLVRPSELGWLAIGAVVGAAVRWLYQLAASIRVSDLPGQLPLRLRDLSGLVIRYPQAVGATSVAVLMPFLARSIASLGGAGDIATLTYALRIVEFPLGAFITVGSVAALPHLAELVVARKATEASRLLGDLLRLTLTAAVPATAALVSVAVPIAAVLFGRGGVTASAVEAIGSVAAVALLSLPAQGASAAFTAVYMADRRLGSAFMVNALGLVTFAVVGTFAIDHYGVLGIASAYSAVQWGLAFALLAGLRGRTGVAPPTGVFRRLVRVAAVGLLGFAPFLTVLHLTTLGAVAQIVVALTGCAAGIGLALLLDRRSFAGNASWRQESS